MDKLSYSWITEDHIDFEYKKYTLLAYLQSVQEKFRISELYPQLADLILHYNNLNDLKNNKDLIFEQFPKKLTGLDIKELKLKYEKLIQDDDFMENLSEIINFSLPRIDKTIREGKDVYEFVEENLELDTVGVMPIYNKEGYLLLSFEHKSEMSVYRYKVSLFTHHKEEFRSISTTYINDEVRSISNSAETVKRTLIKKFNELPNPATFLINSKLDFPLHQTVLPVAKRLLMRNVDFA